MAVREVPSDLVEGLDDPVTASMDQVWPIGESDPTPVEELPGERSATSEVWKNRDGSFTLRAFDVPRYFQAEGSKEWRLIDVEVRKGSDGEGLIAETGPFDVAFEAVVPGGVGGVRVSAADGREVGFSPLGVRAVVEPVLEESEGEQVVVYRDVWPGVDLEYRVTTSGVKEDVVVRDLGASTFGFAVRGSNLEADGEGVGAFVASDEGTELRVASPLVFDSEGRPVGEADPAQRVVPSSSALSELEGSGAAGIADGLAVPSGPGGGAVGGPGASVDPADAELLPADSDQVLIVEVDDAWLAEAELPVRIDPTVTVGPEWVTAWSSTGSRCDNVCQVRAGNSTPPGTNLLWRSVAKMPYESLITNHRTVLTAQVNMAVSSGDTFAKDVSLFWALDNSFSGATGYGHIVTAPVATSGTFDVSDFYRSMVASDTHGAALGVVGEEFAGWYSYKQMSISLDIVYTNPPPTPSLISPADNAVVVTTTPTITASTVVDPDGDSVAYYHRLATGPDAESGQIVNSGWRTSPAWTVPAGSLQDGQSYWWHVYASDGLAMRPAATPRRFVVNLRLGADPVAPMDGLGPVAVNLATGNAVVSAGTPTVAGLAGDVGVSFTYNSRQPRQNGLWGQYWWDENKNRLFDDGPVDLARLDGTISFDWGSGPIAAAVGNDDVLVRWSGFITVPAAGNWALGAINDDGVRIKVGGTTVHDDWVVQGADPSPSYGQWVNFASGQLTKPITVEYYEATGSAVMRLFVKAQSAGVFPGAEVPSGWLSTDAPSLPPRWTLAAGDASVGYLAARVGEHAVTLVLADGSSVEYTRTTGGQAGWKAPKGSNDVMTVTAGKVTVQSEDGRNYEFDAAGRLVKMTSSVDDRSPSAYTYTWSGTPTRLREITDPVSGQKVLLEYGGGSCPTGPPSGMIVAPSGMLCKVTLWDGTVTALWYSGSASDPYLARVEAYRGSGMASITDFVYGEFGKLTEIRSPLSADAVAAGVRSAGSQVHTLVDYIDSGAHQYKVGSITLPEPQPGHPRPAETYTYASSSATVDVAGTAPSVDRSVTWDASWRTFSDSDASGAEVRYGYDAEDRVTARRELHTGLRSSTVYDHAGRPLVEYGPAPSAWFHNGTGYQATPVTNAGEVPTTTTAYDQVTVAGPSGVTRSTGIYGLAAAYFNNPTLAGAPYKHGTALLAGNDGRVTKNWGNNGPNGTTQDNWSVRLTGDITFPTAGTYNLYTISAGGARIFIDDRYIAGDITAEAPAGGQINNGVGTFTTSQPNQVHRIRVEFADRSHNASLHLFWKPPGGTDEIVPSNRLAPRYGLPTTVTAPGGEITTTTYTGNAHDGTASGVRAEHAKPVIVTEGAGTTGALQTSFAYENADATGSMMRLKRKVLPAGNATTYNWFGNTQTSVGCTAGQKQAGRLWRENTPDPDGTGPQLARLHDRIYDDAGRVMGTRTRTVSDDEAWTCHTRDARGRITKTVYPAFGDQTTARTTWVDHKTELPDQPPNPLITHEYDSNSGVRTEVDLLGRTISYTTAGQTTTFAYDQAGRLTSTAIPAVGTIGRTYDTVTNLPATVTLDGNTVASVTYDATTKRTSRVDYPAGTNNAGNATYGLFAYDSRGASSSVGWHGPSGQIAAHTYARTASGRVVDETIDGVDPNPSGWNYTYEAGSKRITSAVVTGATVPVTFTYSYGTNPAGCTGGSILTDAGKNANRATASIPASGGDATNQYSYCYDKADRLVSSTDPAVGTIAYDSHGNMVSVFGETRGYDMANQHIRTTKGSTEVIYKRDVAGRIIERSVNGTVQNRYRYTGSTDVPSVVTNTAGTPIQAAIALPGGASVTLQLGSSSATWSYPNLHGDVMAVADHTGTKDGPTRTYDPYGNPLRGTTPDNLDGQMDWGWLGAHHRPLEHQTGLQPVIEMGARQYSPRLGRFLEVDPIEGGSCSDYDYTCGDPLNTFDLNGTNLFKKIGAIIHNAVTNIKRSPPSKIGSILRNALGAGKRPLVIGKTDIEKKFESWWNKGGELIDGMRHSPGQLCAVVYCWTRDESGRNHGRFAAAFGLWLDPTPSTGMSGNVNCLSASLFRGFSACMSVSDGLSLDWTAGFGFGWTRGPG